MSLKARTKDEWETLLFVLLRKQREEMSKGADKKIRWLKAQMEEVLIRQECDEKTCKAYRDLIEAKEDMLQELRKEKAKDKNVARGFVHLREKERKQLIWSQSLMLSQGARDVESERQQIVWLESHIRNLERELYESKQIQNPNQKAELKCKHEFDIFKELAKDNQWRQQNAMRNAFDRLEFPPY